MPVFLKHAALEFLFFIFFDRDTGTEKNVSNIRGQKVQEVLGTHREWWGLGQTGEHFIKKKQIQILFTSTWLMPNGNMSRLWPDTPVFPETPEI